MFLAGVAAGGLGVTLVLWGAWGTPREPEGPDPLTTPAEAYSWTEQPAPAFPLPPYAKFLEGVIIVLDPGHVGQRDPGGDWKRGPTGLREAEVNLRVCRFLLEFLEASGARVVMTREEDRSLDLPDAEDLRRRVAVANDLRADLLLSVHHNGAASPEANYTSVFFHGDPGESARSVSAARHLAAGLHDALRLETQLACAVLSDRVIFPERGFAVLREAEVPAVLTEGSFHSHPAEEARLRDPVYNRREAYGLFLGLARWARAGLPRVRLVESATQPARPGGEVLVRLDDGLRSRGGWGSDQPHWLRQTLRVALDGRPVAHRVVDGETGVRVRLPRGLGPGVHTLRVDFANLFGQHVLHPELELVVGRR